MREEVNLKFAYLRPQMAAILLLTCLLIVSTSKAREQSSITCDKAKVRERVARIMRDTLKQGETKVNGVVTSWTRIPPSSEAVEEVRCYGDDAVSVLAEYLKSKDSPKKELALRFLGELGGSRIVEPLRMVILYEPSPLLRELALRWLTTAPWDIASPIIKEAMESDADPQVREAAKNILASYAPK